MAETHRAFRVTVRGPLSQRLAAMVDVERIERHHDTTTVIGPYVDQAQVLGVVNHLTTFGLELVRVEIDDEGAQP